MSIVDSFKEYILKEIPRFNPKLLTDDYGSDTDQVMLNRINENLRLSKVDSGAQKRKTTMYLPDLNQKPKQQSMRLLQPGMPRAGQDQEDQRQTEYLDKQQLETDFYVGLKKDIDKILLKAWEGQQDLSDDEMRRFREVMRYKQGQQLFIHLLNQFRVKRLFQIVN